MNKRLILTFFLFLSIAMCAWSQKIRYKDLFILLNAKQYEQAEPYLKKYLKEEDDNPNAYLFMGIIYEEKASKLDILRQTELYVSMLDSAAYFSTLASKIMTEKEVSRNDEYYQAYSRRDMRSGKFGVKLSDVVLDLETRIKLKERARQAVKLKSQLVNAEASYLRCVNLFARLQGSYKDLIQLYLQADDSLVMRLHKVATVADSSHIHFNDYKATSKEMGKTGRNQDLDPQDITDFKKKAGAVDFYADDVKVLDFKRWAMGTVEVLEKEISPLKARLIAHDTEINKLQQRLKNDSVSVRTELAAIRAKSFPELLKIDPNPMPLQLFAMKEAELDFGCQVVENRSLRDSSNLALQVYALRKEIRYARQLDSIAGLLLQRNMDEDAANYKHFVTTGYGTPSVLKSLMRSTKEFALRAVTRREAAVKKKSDFLRWIVNGADSIPLFKDVPAASRFQPLIVLEERYTAGLKFADSVGVGYFYLIVPSRKPEVKATFPVNAQVFKKRYLSLIHI